MKIICLVNNRVGWQVVRWLKEQGEDIVGLIIHPEERRKYGPEILESAAVANDRVFCAVELNRPDVREQIAALQPDIGISAFFGYILKPVFLALFPCGVINLHPSLLPYNRGANPDVWSIVEGTPAGVTLHYIDEGIDTGDIVAQQQETVEATDTAATLYTKLERSCLELFTETWPSIKKGQSKRISQDVSKGTVHLLKDLQAIDCIDLDKSFQGREFINILRGRTFPPYQNLYYMEGGRRVYVRIQLEYEEEHI